MRAARPGHPAPGTRIPQPTQLRASGLPETPEPAYTEGNTTMLILPIDTSQASFIASGEPTVVHEFGTDRPKYSAEGVPLFEVSVMATFSGTSDVIKVKTPGQPQGITAGTVVRLVDLVAIPYAMPNRSGTAFRAARIEPATPATVTTPAAGRGSDRDKG